MSPPIHPLRRFRHRHELRLEDVAGRSGLSAPVLSRIENGKDPSLAQIRKLQAAGIRVSANTYLRAGERRP